MRIVSERGGDPLDSSCLLKLLLSEPESEAVRQAVAREEDVVVSTLTELETTVQLRAGRLGAVFGERRYRAYLGNYRGSASSIRSASFLCRGRFFRLLFASTRPAGSLTVAR